ncbi:MAG: polyphosphate kinase 1, partial [Planctomycetota bacterium]
MSKRKKSSATKRFGGRKSKASRTDFSAKHYINRELSWLEFNRRVLEEAEDPKTPLLERLKFLSIFSSNLDEFFMVRVAGLREQAFEAGAPQDRNVDGLPAIGQLKKISILTRELISSQYDCFDQIYEELKTEQIELIKFEEAAKNPELKEYYKKTVFPILTPMAIDPSHPRPRYHNRALYVIASLRRRKGMGPHKLYAVVQVPPVLPRLIPVSDNANPDARKFLLLEDLIKSRMSDLFGGFEVETSATFRITRDSDIELIEQEADDMLRMIEERLKARRRADAVRLEVEAGADSALVSMIVQQEQIRTQTSHDGERYSEVYYIPGPLDLTGFRQLISLDDKDHLREVPITPTIPRGLRRHGEDLLAAIRRRDILLHHPYDTFDPVVDFVSRATTDPKVLAIKQTVYRTSGDSPIIQSLIEAAENGTHVTALVELKARFDEQANVTWARQLERAGAHVVYGFMDLKTHCKVSMIARQESGGVRRYVHLSTGNYNPTTANVYTDMGLFTANTEIVDDVSALFNLLTGYSQGHAWKQLAVAPDNLQPRVAELIDEQAQRARKGKPARIFAKLNALVDPATIQKLYRASQAGVQIDLVVRGICCLRPGIKG